MHCRAQIYLKNQKKQTQNDRVPLVVTFSSLLPDVHSIVHKHLNVLYKSDRMREVFSKPPLVAYRRDRNLCDTLVHKKTSKATFITHICEANCMCCNKLTTSDIQDTDGKITYSTCKNVTCRTRNVIYGIGCNKCECVVYVGETERQIRERMSEHLRDVRLHKEKPITTHFDSSHCDDNMYFSVLETLNIAGRQERVIREALWIKRLKTMKPFGCNVKDSVFQSATLIDSI